jgi:hypothetical protein
LLDNLAEGGNSCRLRLPAFISNPPDPACRGFAFNDFVLACFVLLSV